MANNLPLPPYSSWSAAEKASARPYVESAAKYLRKGLGTVPKSLATEVGYQRMEGGINSDLLKQSGWGTRQINNAISNEYLGTKLVTKGVLGRAMPWVGAALGANELRKNVPELVKGIPAYMKERKALKQSEANLKDLRAKAAGKLKTKYLLPKFQAVKYLSPATLPELKQ